MPKTVIGPNAEGFISRPWVVSNSHQVDEILEGFSLATQIDRMAGAHEAPNEEFLIEVGLLAAKGFYSKQAGFRTAAVEIALRLLRENWEFKDMFNEASQKAQKQIRGRRRAKL